MFGSVGFWELLALFMLALVVFGPRRLPELGRSLGRAVGMFRRASQEFRETLEQDVAREQRGGSPAAGNARLPAGALPHTKPTDATAGEPQAVDTRLPPEAVPRTSAPASEESAAQVARTPERPEPEQPASPSEPFGGGRSDSSS